MGKKSLVKVRVIEDFLSFREYSAPTERKLLNHHGVFVRRDLRKNGRRSNGRVELQILTSVSDRLLVNGDHGNHRNGIAACFRLDLP